LGKLQSELEYDHFIVELIELDPADGDININAWKLRNKLQELKNFTE